MLQKSPGLTNWPRFIYSLIVFTAVLVYVELFWPGISAFNSMLDQSHAQIGYIAAVRGMTLVLWLVVALSMVSLFRLSVPVAPLAWAVQLVRVGLVHNDPWYEAGNSLFFVSPILNFALMAIVPPLLAMVLWWSFEQLTWRRFRRFLDFALVPGLWLAAVALVAAGNLFLWYWSQIYAVNYWPSNLGLVLLIAGVPLVLQGSSQRPLAALLLYWAGLLVPVVFGWTIWGWYEGTAMGLLTLVPGLGVVNYASVWVELLLLFALPVLVVLGVHQFQSWRQGKKLLEFW